jgi:hypothetical protein
MILSKRLKISELGWWMVARIVMPLLASFFIYYMIRSDVVESRPEVGSSRSRILGSVISSYPIDVRFLSPPEIPLIETPPTLVFWHLVMLSLWMISSTFAIILY